MQNAIKTRQDQHDKQPRLYVDAPAVFAAIAKHLPGEWTIRKQGELEQYAASSTRWCDIERKADGLRLSICASTNYDREPAIRVSMSGYSYPASGQTIDLRWCREKAGVDKVEARMSIANTTAEKLAKTITRRVIVPAEKVLPFVLQLIADAQSRDDQKQVTIRALQAIKGVDVRIPAYGNDVTVYAGDAHMRVESDGGLRVEYFYADAKDAAKVAAFLLTIKRKRD